MAGDRTVREEEGAPYLDLLCHVGGRDTAAAERGGGLITRNAADAAAAATGKDSVNSSGHSIARVRRRNFPVGPLNVNLVEKVNGF